MSGPCEVCRFDRLHGSEPVFAGTVLATGAHDCPQVIEWIGEACEEARHIGCGERSLKILPCGLPPQAWLYLVNLHLDDAVREDVRHWAFEGQRRDGTRVVVVAATLMLGQTRELERLARGVLRDSLVCT